MNEPNGHPAPRPDVAARSLHPPARSRPETIFLGSIVSLSLLATLGLLILASRGILVPAMGIAILAATGVATLVYAFLGGQGDSFQIQGMKLAGAAAVFAIIIIIVNSRLDSQMKDLLEHGRQQAAQRQLLLDEGSGAQTILGGGTVRLKEVTTFDGWLEGPTFPDGDAFRTSHGRHEGNKGRADAAQVFAAIFGQQSIQRPVSEVLNMSQREWESFLRDLPENKRNAIGGIPFAVLETRSSDGPLARKTVLKGDDVTVRNPRGQVEAVLCVLRILDTRTRSGEPEVVVLAQGTRTCSQTN